MIAIVAALPREIALLVRGLAADQRLRREGVYLYRLADTLVVAGGMGSTRVTLAVKAAREAGEVHMLVSTGLAGACSLEPAVGSVVDAAVVIDVQSGERFATGRDGVTLVTSHSIASVKEKLRLHQSYGAAVVDMEAATVARLATMHGLEFRAVKAVSDAHDFELSSLSRFASAHGHFRTGAFALHTALRPHRWRQAMRLGAGSQKALRALNERLKEMI